MESSCLALPPPPRPSKIIIATLGSNLGISALLEILQDLQVGPRSGYKMYHKPPHSLRNPPTTLPAQPTT